MKSPSRTFASLRKIVLFVAGFALVLGGVVWWQLKRGSREPEYDGRPLSYWLNNGREGTTSGSKVMPYRLKPESAAAVRAIGTNAFPKLREWMTEPEKGWRTRAYAWAQQTRLPSVLHELATSIAGYDHYDPMRSALAFQAMGADATAAIPFLIEMLEQNGNGFGALMGLCAIQPEGVNALMETFPKIDDDFRRANIVSILQHTLYPESVSVCSSFLAKCVVEDRHVAVRMSAARVLGTFTNSAAVTVPALTKALTDRDGAVRFIACQSLALFGKEAVSATVALRAALKDSHPQVRADAARALQAIGAPAVE